MTLGETSSQTLLAYSALVFVVLGNVMGNLFMKLGAGPQVDGFRIFGVFGCHTFVGIAFLAMGVLLYAWALRYIDLHIAQAVVALQFVGALLVAAYYFGEVITPIRGLGLLLIMVGLTICVWPW